MTNDLSKIRNFSIIAHIDHGKSTLSDRILEITKTVAERDRQDQILDSMDIERERGITIKSSAVNLTYKAKDGIDYNFNLIDTPGHVDFSYEVSRALACCEGAILVIDASQGVQAQTLANLYKALNLNLAIIPVINKVDLPSANVDGVLNQIENELALEPEKAIQASAKDGIGITEILEAIVKEIPAPKTSEVNTLRALIFDSLYDTYKGTIVYCRIFDGEVKPGDQIKFMASSDTVYKVEEVGIFKLKMIPRPTLSAGEVGYIMAGIKSVSEAKTGDTITSATNPALEPLKGFQAIKPVVFSSIYPTTSEEYEKLTEALHKLKLNDASLTFQKDSSAALGFGYRCGFYGLLHLEIVQERLEREFDLSLVLTAPSVNYKIKLRDGTILWIDNPTNYPDPTTIEETEEPYIKATMIFPDKYYGSVIKLCIERRGVNSQMNYISKERVELTVEIPLSEVIYDFYDTLKSYTQGYGSFDYELLDYRKTKLAKLDFLVNSDKIDALSILTFEDNAYDTARRICERLKDEIPRHMFKIAIQGAIGGKIIARETVNPFRKDVLAKCYGGDVSRKRKLLEKQKKGKKKMKTLGAVEIPQSAFIAVLKRGDDE